MTQPDLRTLAAEAIALALNGPASDGRGWYRTASEREDLHRQADAVLAAVLPDHERQVAARERLSCWETLTAEARAWEATAAEYRADPDHGDGDPDGRWATLTAQGYWSAANKLIPPNDLAALRRLAAATPPAGPEMYAMHDHGDGERHSHSVGQTHQGSVTNPRANDHSGVPTMSWAESRARYATTPTTTQHATVSAETAPAVPEVTPDDAPLGGEARALAEHFRHLDCGQVVDPVDLEDCGNMAEEVLRFLTARGWRASAVPEADGQRAGEGPYRVGRKVGRTIYRMAGGQPSDADELIGVMDSPALAAFAVRGMNTETFVPTAPEGR